MSSNFSASLGYGPRFDVKVNTFLETEYGEELAGTEMTRDYQ